MLLLQQEFWKGDKENQEETVRNIYGLEHQEPNIAFALCSGSRSSPAVSVLIVVVTLINILLLKKG